MGGGGRHRDTVEGAALVRMQGRFRVKKGVVTSVCRGCGGIRLAGRGGDGLAGRGVTVRVGGAELWLATFVISCANLQFTALTSF